MKSNWPLLGSLVHLMSAVLAQNPIAYASNPIMNVDSLSPSPELKTMLLHNLNKHSDGEETLEALGSSKSHAANKHSSATALPISLDLFKPMSNQETTTAASSIDELPFNVVQNFFDEQTSLPKPAAFAPDPLRTSGTPLSGFGDLLRPLSGFTLPTITPLQPLPNLPPLVTLPPLQFLEDLSRQQRSSVNPVFYTTTTTTASPSKARQISGPRFVNQSQAIPPEHVQMWRRRFYKVFKEIKNQYKKTVNSDSDENNPASVFKNDAWQHVRKPVEEDAMSMAQQVNNRVGQLPVEHSGYSYNGENSSNGRSLGNREASFSGLGSKQRQLLQNRTALLSEFAPHFRSSTIVPKTVVSNDYDEELANDLAPQVDDDTNFEEEPCQAVGCSSHLWQPQKDADNRETCNSLRLKVLIENSIVASDAEQSKRIIQTRTEAEFGNFYNVICGNGFFSYIAHTSEFCLASKDEMNCYVFSPVCTDNLGIADGLVQRNRRLLGLRQKALKLNLKRHKKAYVNRN